MAANPRALAKALLAANANPTPSNLPVGGAFGGVPATLPGNGISPMVASYDAWSNGRSVGAALPRDWSTFLAGSFGPLAPIQPIPIDNPEPGTDYPQPRRWSYQTGWNMPLGPPGSEGLKLATFAQLRTIADTYSVARACINVRKQELVGLDWDIIPTKAAEKKMRGDKVGRRDFDERRAKIMRFFRKPDPNYFSFGSWFGAQLEDVMAVDALSLYLHPPRVKGKGVMGSNLAAFELIDGTTIRPLVDVHGATPTAPNPAYQQYIYGVPRSDLMTVLTGDDIHDMGDAMYREYSGTQLMYLPYDARDWTPYGFAPVEKAIVPILSGLNRQNWQLEYFSEGSVPGMFITAGDETATPQQIRELQDALNAMAGDPAWKHKIIVLPKGAVISPQTPAELAGAFDDIIMTQVCMAFDVMPMELGISPRTSSSQSAGAANQMAKASQSTHDRKANGPLLKRFMEIYDHIIQIVLEQDDMRFMFEGLESGEDESTQVSILVNELSHGLRSIDEARIMRGEQPWGLPITSDPVMMTATGIIPIGSLDPVTGQPPQPALPPAPPGAPAAAPAAPAGPAPAPAPEPSGTAAPTVAKAVNTYAALRELDLIRRRLAKGVSIAGWRPEHIPADVFATISGVADIATARALVKMLDRRQRRGEAIDRVEEDVTEGLRRLGAGLATGAVPAAQFVDNSVGVMRAGIREGLAAGAAHGRSDGLVKGALPDGFESRLHLYGGSVPKAYEQGYGLAVYGHADNPDHIVVRWHARPGACALCEPRGGKGYTVEDLDGFPGEGGFGGPICMGGPNCRCVLSYEHIEPPAPDAVPVAQPTPPVTQPAARVTPPATTGMLERLADARQALQTPDPATAFETLLDRVADDMAEAQRPYLMGLLQDILAARNTQSADRVTAAYTTAPDGGHGWFVPAAVIAALVAFVLAEQAASQAQAAPVTVGAPADATVTKTVKAEPGQRYRHGWIPIDGVDPKAFDDDRHRMGYLAERGVSPRTHDRATVEAVNRYTRVGGYNKINNALRAGKTTPDVKRIDSMMKPLDDHLALTRVAGPELFAGLDKPEDLVGTTRTDTAYLSTALGQSYLEHPAGVTVHITAPAGTRAVIPGKASSFQGEREVLLDRGLAIRFTGVSRNAAGGYNVTATVVPGGAKDAGLVKHDGHNDDQMHHVYAYLARHYPASVLEWVRSAHWHGPTSIPLDKVTWAYRPGGARNPAKVDAIEHHMAEGKKLDPIVVVRAPGSSKYQIADGWHRTDAVDRAGGNYIEAWVGHVSTRTGPWGATMNQAKLNKCLTCGCLLPNDDHHDHDHITIDDLTAAADAAGISTEQAWANMRETLAAFPAQVDKVGPGGWSHGWRREGVPTIARTQREIESAYGQHDTNAEFAAGSYVEQSLQGNIHIDIADTEPDKWHVAANMDKATAARLVDSLDEMLTAASDHHVGDDGERVDPGHDPVNGMADWQYVDGIMVGYKPDGNIRIGFPADQPGQLNILDLTHEQAMELNMHLDFMASD